MMSFMPHFRISEAAELLSVSDDTLRRWIDAGRLPATTDGAGRRVVDGVDLAHLAQDLAGDVAHPGHTSARNQFRGLVTRVVSDTVMSQVELQCGPFRVVSLISTEAVHDLGLAPGVVTTARVKATNVVLEH
jgi:molybdopterin-binding protein